MKKYLIGLMGLIVSACAHPMAHFTVVSDRNIEGLPWASDSPPRPRVRGESCRDDILFIPITSRRDVNLATADALQKAPNTNALKDVVLTSDGLFTLFYNRWCYIIEGTPVQLGK